LDYGLPRATWEPEKNFQPLPQRLNASKSNTIQGTNNEWIGHKGENIPLNPQYSNALKDSQDQLRIMIQNEIDKRLKN